MVTGLSVTGLLPRTAHADDHPCQGTTIAGLRLDGCDDFWCEPPLERGKLLSLSDVASGQTWDEAAIERARARFEATELFRAVEAHCQMRDDGRVDVLIRVFPHRWVRRVEFEGNSSLFDSELNKRMFLRPGVPFNDDEVGLAERRRQEDLLVRRYEKEGFDDVKVSIGATPVGADQVDLTVTVIEGDKRKVSAIDVAVTRQILDSVVGPFGESIECPRFSARDIRKASQLSGGDAFTDRRRRQARRAVISYLRSHGVLDPRVEVSYDDDRRRTRIEVDYNRCFALRFQQRNDQAPGREGFVAAETDELLPLLPFGESGAFDLEEAELGRLELEGYYQQLGYLFADVQLDFRRAPTTEREVGGVQGVISYYITLGYKSEIRAITISGNSALDDDTLIELMKTRTYDAFGKGGYLLVEQLLGDLAAIRERYRQQGYYEMSFPEARKGGTGYPPIIAVARSLDPETDDRLYDYYYADMHFRLRRPPLESVIYIEIVLSEGARAQTGQVNVEGTGGGRLTDVQLDELRATLVTRSGAPWSPTQVGKDIARIEEYFQQRGHHQLQIAVTCNGWEGRALAQTCGKSRNRPCDDTHCNWRQVSAGRVDLRFAVDPGPAIAVGEVIVRGNERTADSLIIDKLPTTGEPLSRLQLDEAERAIRGLGVFSEVEFRLIGLEETPIRDRVAIVVQLQESHSRFVEARVGVETLVQRESELGVPAVASAISGSIGVGDSMLLGHSQSTPLNIPNFLTFFGIAYRDQNFAGRAIELEIPLKYGVSLPEDFETASSWADAFSRYIELRPTIYEPRLGGTDIALSASLFARYDRATLDVDEFETGATVALAFTNFDHLRTTLSVTASGNKVGEVCDSSVRDCSTVELPAIFEKPADFPDHKTFRVLDPKVDVEVNSTLDYLDNPIHPTRGFAIGTRLNYLLSNASSEATESIANRVLGSFLKWEINVRGAFSIREFMIIAAYFRYADSASFGDADRLPVEERYRLGGIHGIRGLEDESVRPVDDRGDPIGGIPGGDSLLMGTVELRVPVLRRAFGELWLGFFLDWGGLAEATDEFTPESIRWTAGVGIRTLISGIAIRFDVGFNPDPRCKVRDDGSPIRTADGACSNDTEAIAQTHFGLLYTF